MNSFDLVKFRNQLLAENDSVRENTLKLKTAKPTNVTNSINFAQDVETGEGGAIGEALEENNSPEYMKGYGDGYIDGYQAGKSGLEPEVEINEGQLDEMASFYKLSDNSPEAIAAIQAKKEKFKPGSAIYNTLDTLEKNGEIDYKVLSKETGKDIATYNNPKSREVLEKDLAAYIQAGSSPSAIRTGRPADPNKVNSTPKENTPKLKITNPKPNSTKLADLAPSGLDGEEAEMEKQALKAAKGNKRLGTNIEKLAQVTKEMKALAKEYQAAKGTPEEANIVAQLKTLTAEKKALEKKTTPKQMTAADLMGDEDI